MEARSVSVYGIGNGAHSFELIGPWLLIALDISFRRLAIALQSLLALASAPASAASAAVGYSPPAVGYLPPTWQMSAPRSSKSETYCSLPSYAAIPSALP